MPIIIFMWLIYASEKCQLDELYEWWMTSLPRSGPVVSGLMYSLLCTVTLCEEVWILKRLNLLKSNTNPDGFIGIMLFEYQILYSQNWIYFNAIQNSFISDFRVSSVVTSYIRTAACSLSCTKRNNSYNRNPILIAYSVYIHCRYERNYLLFQKPLKWWVILDINKVKHIVILKNT